MTRRENWTVAARGAYTGKPRPAVLVQDDRIDAIRSVTTCAMTTDPTDAPLFRLEIQPDQRTGLNEPSPLMVDNLTTVPKASLGTRLGRLGEEGLLRLNRAVVVFLGLA